MPSLSSEKPSWQSQEKLPMVFTQMSSQPPLLSAHSLSSTHNTHYNDTHIYTYVTTKRLSVYATGLRFSLGRFMLTFTSFVVHSERESHHTRTSKASLNVCTHLTTPRESITTFVNVCIAINSAYKSLHVNKQSVTHQYTLSCHRPACSLCNKHIRILT